MELNWQQVAAGVWKAQLGEIQKFDLLKAGNAVPRRELLEKLGNPLLPSVAKLTSAENQQGKISVRIPLQRQEQVYGLGLNFKSTQQRGKIFTLHTDHYGGSDNGRSHAPVPFYVSNKNYGVFINSAEYITVYAGTGVRKESGHPPIVYDRNTSAQWEAQPYSDAVEILVPAGGTEIYLFAGENTMEVVQRFNLFTGGGVLPPKWGLGFTQRMPSLSTEADVRKEVQAFEEKKFPLDFIGLEPGWQSKSYPCTFEWDALRFPDPEGLTHDLLRKGIRLNLWLNPYLSPASAQFAKLRPLSGSHTVWNGLVPDFNLPEVRKIYKELFSTKQINIGISGYKIDEIDGYDNWLWPDVATFPSGISAGQMRQVFPLEILSTVNNWFKEKNLRTWGLARANNAGGSSLPFVIYNDYYDHRDFITALCNSSFIGVLWTPEVRASKTPEEWLRRIQSVCFSPMAMLNAWADGTKPWSFPDVAQQVNDAAMLRMRLFPYLYTTFAQYYFSGKPPIRSMNLLPEFCETDDSVTGNLPWKGDICDQFMLGDNLLVAPMFAGEKKRKIILPNGKWFDFYTGNYAGEHQVIEVEPGLDHIPLFVKDGGMIPMTPAAIHIPSPDAQVPLEIQCYGDKDAQFDLYDDDGVSFNFERGEFSWYTLRASKNKDHSRKGELVLPQQQKKMGQYSTVQWIFMTGNNSSHQGMK